MTQRNPAALVGRRVLHHATSAGLFLLFAWQTVEWLAWRLRDNWPVFWPGSDVRIYYRAAQALVSGADPYAAHFNYLHVAAPPPSLLPFVPLVLLPEDVAVWIAVCGGLAVAAWTLLRLRLPLWWLLFPPIVEAVWTGSPNTVMVALLVGGAPALAGIVKVYALVPAVLLGKWRAVLVASLVVAVTAPFLPWEAFLASGLSTLEGQNHGLSAWGQPVLMVAVSVALFLVGRQRAAWLAVPGLWPHSQMNYGMLALPVMTPVLAAFMAFREPWAVSAGIVCAALLEAQIPSLLRRYTFKSTAVRVVVESTGSAGMVSGESA